MTAAREFRYRVGAEFDFRLAVFGHGWVDLPPFAWDAERSTLAVAVPHGRGAVDVRVWHRGASLIARVESRRELGAAASERLRQVVPHMLRLEEDLESFWALCRATPSLAWVAARRGGRILRGGSVFEDLLKLLFTTNCSWAATRGMTTRLVAALGVAAPSGRHAFPSAEVCAAEDETFYRDEVRAGYRSSSCRRLAEMFASGAVDASTFTAPDLPVDEVRVRLLQLPGFGPYAAGQALRLLGRYQDLALDSWCRARLKTLLGRRQPPADAAVAKRYARFQPYAGLAMWMELTADWHGEGAAAENG